MVNEKGEIVDKSGKVIGSVLDLEDNEKLVGGTVTESGDVVSNLGGARSKVHIDDNYTPGQAPEKTEGSGDWDVLGKAKTTKQSGENIRTAVSHGQNLHDKLAGGQKSEAEDTGQDITGKEKAGEGEEVEGAKESAAREHQIPTPVQMESRDDTTRGNTNPETEGLKLQGGQKEDDIETETTEDQKPAASTLEMTGNGEQRDESVSLSAAKRPEPTADGDTKEGSESLKEETTEAKSGGNLAKETEDAPCGDEDMDAKEATEGVTGNFDDNKLDETKQDDLKPGEDQLGDSKLDDIRVDEAQLGEEKLDDTKLDETKPDEGAFGETKDEATGKVEESADKAGEIVERALDFTLLKGTKVNKAGSLVNDKGDIVGRLVDGDPKQLIGKTADEEGRIWNDSGKVVGKAEPIPDNERDAAAKDFAPFENFPDATVEADGRVMSEGKQVGEVVEGDPKRLKGSHVDEDGDILDRRGNVIGKAKPWEEPVEVPEEVVDMSSLAGKRVNKTGNVVDSNGQIWGRVIDGDVKALVSRMCDKEGNIMSESGDKIGKAELVSEHEREASSEGPFAELAGCTVTKDGKVVTATGEVVGRLTSGDAKILYGRSVDEDGDVLDKNGNVLGKAERWEEPEVDKKKNPLAGRKVNREGNVVDEDGNIIGKLVSGDVNICSGKRVDDDGDVVNSKGDTIGHVSLLEDIPPEPTESAEEKEALEQAERDRKLAGQLAALIEQSLDKIKPILKMITDKVDKAECTPKDELDEEQLVSEVKPLIEEGSKILTETNGAVRGMDPDGRIQRQAKFKSSTNEATPEEHHLAEVLKEVS